MPKFTSSKDLMAALKPESQVPELVGLIKEQDGDDSIVLFAHPSSCDHWVAISIKDIDDIKLIRNVICGDHSHPLAKVVLKKPKRGLEDTFARLSQLHHDTSWAALNAQHNAYAGRFTGGLARAEWPGSGPCHFDWATGRYVCP